ncbi:cobalamin biosynthesis protein [Thioalkalivibrio versutus]|uniref:Cobalamin biosynthesis protein n=1 Tax=Thioalkalivibrio versutus TaxID=106634 RepID=A0A0G3G0K1_9GAMM|nr:cobalamin biosynthesis protein [Thioalkalivibrio versutus]AKJ94723.1 cobalamin biosynthesis protein [Thioalkalivibrio versutus]
MNGAPERVVPGVGFASACTARELEGLIRTVLAEARAVLEAECAGVIEIRELAAPAHKRDSGMLATVARELELELVFPSASALVDCDEEVLTESARARTTAGVGSVAEAAALAAAGEGARLLLPRRLSARASCAVARVDTHHVFKESL